MNQESVVDNIGLQFTHSDKEQIALLTREMIHLKEEMGIDSTTANLQEEKQKLLEEKDRLFRKWIPITFTYISYNLFNS